jgi:hypothetical protein
VSKKINLDEFREISNLLENADVDDDLSRERIYNRVRYKMETKSIYTDFTEGDNIQMNKNRRRNMRKSVAIAVLALVCLVGGFSVTAYGKEVIHNIIASFQAGNIEITQYDKLPEVDAEADGGKKTVGESTAKYTSIEDARSEMGVYFAVPNWLPEGFSYTASILHSENAVELQYNNEGDGTFFSLLITKGENGIATEGDVKEETIAGQKVYFANGITLWGQDGLNYELYYTGEKDFDREILENMLGNMTYKEVSYDKAPPENTETDGEFAGQAGAARAQ